jgi:hypothetical protein
MDKKEEFKNFAKGHPELLNSIKSGDTSWQKLYEIYDIYGEDTNAWNTYFNKGTNNNLNNITDIVKNIDMDSVQKHIHTAQKALDLVAELTGKGSSTSASTITKGPTTPRPINHFFED